MVTVHIIQELYIVQSVTLDTPNQPGPTIENTDLCCANSSETGQLIRLQEVQKTAITSTPETHPTLILMPSMIDKLYLHWKDWFEGAEWGP
jgi:hypothetical protein